ncbi:Putative Transcription initiation factor IIA large subunit Short=TFIIA large subunit [[Torrubiella] hemipterigena]|uniref:Transcription initiation factor IIA large subunit n=1 Tax=[Torrubiella] hemipterigena TaxID=1531966 RepID=A0A0A1TFD7_9HYPO|nr:Putative Transcription initiation factor IIA large subunit Short=TFIIA large subunit [[Torrubiella] hemipterigena]
MSNTGVGSVYQTIINEVINSSRVDFEENGIEESALEELRKGWQQKLTQLDVASFPWDPVPEPAAAPVPNAGVAATQAYVPSPTAGTPINGGATDIAGVKMEAGIKAEPTTQTAGIPNYPPYNGVDNKNSVAASRAAQQLQAQYGVRAAGSINAIQDRMGQQQRPPHSQTDGAADLDDETYEGVIMQRSKAGTLQELGRVDIDRILHAKIAANSRAMEGGGLMLSLKEATGSGSAAGTSRKGKGVAAFDGGDDDDDDDDEEEDEDAINSDLDDPEDEDGEDEVDEDGLGHIMLCTYDKVQRVKNKWKCVLKDGVLTVNGKEYVFHKASGEYEW